MINQMDQKRLSVITKKVRSFCGAGVYEIYAKLDGILKKKPSNIILHVGTNEQTIKMPHWTERSGYMYYMYYLTILQLVKKIKSLNINYLCNVNIWGNCLGVKGLHLNPRGWDGSLLISYLWYGSFSSNCVLNHENLCHKTSLSKYNIISVLQVPDAFLHSQTTLTLNLQEDNMKRYNVGNKGNVIKRKRKQLK